ncbi:MAG TPA: ATP-binding protein, partial [Deinococcales bacterium]|nr:ATP-binding protein [Deinococcales bacterium]
RGEALERTSARALELRSFLSLFTQAQEEERRRIARELHDDTAQTLVAIGRRLDRLQNSLEACDSTEVGMVQSIRQDLDTAIASVRRFARNLRPSVLDDLGLLPALEWLASQARTPTRVEVRGPSGRAIGRPSPDLELTIFRVVQEALTNVDKHAQASSAAVRVRFDPLGEDPAHGVPGLTVSVQDDGRGFEEAPGEDSSFSSRALAGLAAAGHLGLAGMRERVNLVGGELSVRSEPGLGSELTFWFRWRPAGA